MPPPLVRTVTLATVAAALGGVVWLYSRKRRNERSHAECKAYQQVASAARIIVASTTEECILAVNALMNDTISPVAIESSSFPVSPSANHPLALGFDVEWKPVGGSKVSLLQLSTPRVVALIRLHLLSEIPKSLIDLLSDPKVLKVGVGCTSDASKLHSDYGLVVRGCVELAGLAARTCDGDFSKLQPVESLEEASTAAMLNSSHTTAAASSAEVKTSQTTTDVRSHNSTSLQGLTQRILQIHLPKHKHITCSNWEAETLTHHQIAYAAADAFYGAQIFIRLFCIRRTTHHKGAHSLTWSVASLSNWCKGIVDARAKQKDKTATLPAKPKRDKAKASAPLPPSCKQLGVKCNVIDNQGAVVAVMPTSKLVWYFSRGIARAAGGNSVQMTYPIPAGYGYKESNTPAYFHAKTHKASDKCMACGITKSAPRFRKHAIVPVYYRRHFPPQFKSRNTHDVVILCADCYARICAEQDRFHEQLAQEFKIDTETDSLAVDASLASAQKNAALFKRLGDRVPETRRAQLLDSVGQYMGRSAQDITDAELCDLLVLPDRPWDPKKAGKTPQEKRALRVKSAQAYQVARKLMAGIRLTVVSQLPSDADSAMPMLSAETTSWHEALTWFYGRWRQHFLETMKPQHMPAEWSVDHVPQFWTLT